MPIWTPRKDTLYICPILANTMHKPTDRTEDIIIAVTFDASESTTPPQASIDHKVLESSNQMISYDTISGLQDNMVNFC